MITAKQAHDLFEYDNGILYRKKTKTKAGRTKGTAKYDSVSVNNKRYYSHRIIWLMHKGEWPKDQIDHINMDKWDNRIENLREVSPELNNHNINKPRKTNKLGVLGVVEYIPGRFVAHIQVKGKLKHIGVYGSPEQAHQAYLNAKRALHAGCTI
jgi:hypothetical protein